MAKISANTKVVTGEARLSFPVLFEPRVSNLNADEDPKYSVQLIIPKTDTATVAAIRKVIEDVKADAATPWSGKKLPKDFKDPLRDGDEERDTDERPEYAGAYFVNANSKFKPTVLLRDGSPAGPEDIYSGCYGRASLEAAPFSVNGSMGIKFYVTAVMKTQDGHSLSGGGGLKAALADFGIEDAPGSDLL